MKQRVILAFNWGKLISAISVFSQEVKEWSSSKESLSRAMKPNFNYINKIRIRLRLRLIAPLIIRWASKWWEIKSRGLKSLRATSCHLTWMLSQWTENLPSWERWIWRWEEEWSRRRCNTSISKTRCTSKGFCKREPMSSRTTTAWTSTWGAFSLARIRGVRIEGEIDQILLTLCL